MNTLPAASSPAKINAFPDRLYADNLALAGFCLRRFPSLTGDDREEARSAAMIGLWMAARSYDPGRGVRFSSYATVVIRSHILLHLKAQQRQSRLFCVSLETPIGDNGSDLAEMLADEDAEKPGQALVEDAGFESLLSGLRARQQTVLRALYQEERSLAEIGDAERVTRQRIQQIHEAALGKLRQKMLNREAARRQHRKQAPP